VEDRVAEFGQRTVTEAGVHAFGCLTGDYARMHLDHEFGRTTPQGGPIAHGLLNACWAMGALTQYAADRLRVADPEAWLAGFNVRLSRMVAVGDTTAFEVPNQRGEVTSSGVVTVCHGDSSGGRAALPDPPEPWAVEAWQLPDSPSIFHAEDIFESGPRGETPGQTVTETDVVAFAREVGELNPRYLNAEFARRALFGERIAPPMLVFCLGFAEWLQVLLRTPMPSSGFAGHLGDSWRFFRPVRFGDTIRTRHRPLSCERSRSRPGRAIVHFGLQMINQSDEVVQDGQVVMMMNARPDA
jgi:acyl dehydratase